MRSATTGAPAIGPATPRPTPPRSGPATSVPVLALALAGVLMGVLLAGPALAAPEPDPSAGPTASAAVVDAGRPTARVVHGPNCSDGYVRVQVTNGTAEHTVTLQYDGVDVADPVTLEAGAGTLLEGPEVDGGQTVDVQVTVTGADGPEAPLPLSDYTRPTQQDCDAVGNPSPTPTTSAPAPTSSTPAPTTSAAPSTSPVPTTPVPTTPAPTTTPTTPRPTPSATTAPSPTAPTGVPTPSSSTGGPTGPAGGSASAGQVSPGSVVTIRGSGFDPGEQVSVSLAGIATPLATVTADEQGRVEAVVQIPRDVVLGPAVVQLVGQESAAATEVALEVAARETTEVAGGTPWPLAAAGLALLAVAAALVAATRRPRADDWQPPAGAA